MNKRKISFILNIFLLIFFIIGFFKFDYQVNLFLFYTEDSNLLGAISSLLFIISYLCKKEWKCVGILRYVSTVCLTLTYLMVVFVLAPTFASDLKESIRLAMINGSMLYHHSICPVLSFISFEFFEKDHKSLKAYQPLIVTIIYGIIVISLNILRIVDGPYPFLQVYNQSLYISLIWFVIIGVGNFLISYLILKINNRRG